MCRLSRLQALNVLKCIRDALNGAVSFAITSFRKSDFTIIEGQTELPSHRVPKRIHQISGWARFITLPVRSIPVSARRHRE